MNGKVKFPRNIRWHQLCSHNQAAKPLFFSLNGYLYCGVCILFLRESITTCQEIPVAVFFLLIRHQAMFAENCNYFKLKREIIYLFFLLRSQCKFVLFYIWLDPIHYRSAYQSLTGVAAVTGRGHPVSRVTMANCPIFPSSWVKQGNGSNCSA